MIEGPEDCEPWAFRRNIALLAKCCRGFEEPRDSRAMNLFKCDYIRSIARPCQGKIILISVEVLVVVAGEEALNPIHLSHSLKEVELAPLRVLDLIDK